MKILLTILLFWTTAQGQLINTVIGPFPGYGRIANERNATNNIRIAFSYHLPASALAKLAGGGNPNQRYMIVIDEHGCGERSSTFGSYAAITTAELYKLLNNGMAQYLNTPTSDYVGKKWAKPGTTDSMEVIYIFPQAFGGATSNPCAINTGLGIFVSAYPYYLIQWVKSTFPTLVDTTHIYLTGLSFGGFGVWVAMQDPGISHQVAGFIAACPGGIDLRNIGGGSNWPEFDDWFGFGMLIHSTDDGSTLSGSKWSDEARDSLLKRHAPGNFLYVRKTTGNHGGSWTCWQVSGNRTVPFPCSNGTNYYFSTPWQALLLNASRQSRTK